MQKTDNFADAAADFPEPFRLLVRDSVESTNDDARDLAISGAADGLIVLAHQQLAGRGRRGAAWFSPAGESLAFSIIVRPEFPKALWPRLALAAGLAVAEAVESLGLEIGIKWPNDLVLKGRKVAGILVEAGTNFAIIGIGLNVNTTEFPPAVRDIATSLQIEGGQQFSRPDVLAAIIHKFAIRRHQIGENFENIVDGVRARCVLTGHRVTLNTPNGPRIGLVEDIGAGGELLLRTEHGVERLIQADEVRLAIS